MCELRREIIDIIRCCVRLRVENEVDANGACATSLRLVLVDQETGDEAILGDPVIVGRRSGSAARH